MENKECVDAVSIPFGFRKIVMTSDNGLLLNGKRITKCGVAKHQDFEGMGCAPICEQLDQDMALKKETDANAMRLFQYQHPYYFRFNALNYFIKGYQQNERTI